MKWRLNTVLIAAVTDMIRHIVRTLGMDRSTGQGCTVCIVEAKHTWRNTVRRRGAAPVIDAVTPKAILLIEG